MPPAPQVPRHPHDERLDDRYGAQAGRRRTSTVAGVVVLAAGFVAWVVWAALGADPGPRAQVTAFRVVSPERIEVRVAPTAGVSGRLVCSVRALDRTREVVGVAGVGLDALVDGPRGRWVSLRTRAQAVTATVGACSSR